MEQSIVRPGVALAVPGEPFSEEETSHLLDAVREIIDVPRRKSEPATKTLLLDFFGTGNAGKTRTTEKVEQVLRRHKWNLFCPPETAEIEEIRNRSTDDPVVFQARHLTGVQNYVLNLAYDRNFHAVIISRGLIDMLYWYEMGLRRGDYSQTHVESVRSVVFEFLRMDLVDAYFFFTCSVEEAMRREYEESVTVRQGSNTNEQKLAEALELYQVVLEDVEREVPGLPIYRIDTTNMSIRETTQEVFRCLLPTVCARYDVPGSSYLPQSLTLMEKEAARTGWFEEQLKLKGHVPIDTLVMAGWTHVKTYEQRDVCLNPWPDRGDSDGVFDEIVRVRRQEGRVTLIYKSRAEDRIFSHRRPLELEISPEKAEEIQRRYPKVLEINKERAYFRLDETDESDVTTRFTLHRDTIEGLGAFTEIRAHGTDERTHTEELLELATALGFTPADIVEGSYLTVALKLAHRQ